MYSWWYFAYNGRWIFGLCNLKPTVRHSSPSMCLCISKLLPICSFPGVLSFSIHLAAPGLPCGMQILYLWNGCLLVWSVRSSFPTRDQSCPLRWECGVLATGQPAVLSGVLGGISLFLLYGPCKLQVQFHKGT